MKRPARLAPSACGGCGDPARRWTDGRGRAQTNLDPTTGLCVACISNYWHRAAALEQQQLAMPFDARAAAARNDA